MGVMFSTIGRNKETLGLMPQIKAKLGKHLAMQQRIDATDLRCFINRDTMPKRER